MRGDITAALLHEPEILYLDEPTIGLDVVSKGRLREFLRTLNAERAHDPDAHHPRPPGHRGTLRPGDRDRPRHRGLRRPDGRPARTRGGSHRTLVVDLVDEAPPIAVAGAETERVEGPRQWLSFPAGTSAAPIVAAVAAAYDVADLSIHEPDIEDVIRDLYAGSLSRGGNRRWPDGNVPFLPLRPSSRWPCSSGRGASVDYTRTDPREMRTFEPMVWLVLLVRRQRRRWRVLGDRRPGR